MQALSSGERVDLMLLEVEGPKGKGLRMLRHIVKQEALQHIPIISECPPPPCVHLRPAVMSSRDKMAVVVECLRPVLDASLLSLMLCALTLPLTSGFWRSDVVARRDGSGGQVPAPGGRRLSGEAPAHQRAPQPLDPHVAPQERGQPFHPWSAPALTCPPLLRATSRGLRGIRPRR